MSRGARIIALDARGYFRGQGIGRYTRNLVRELAAQRPSGVVLRLIVPERDGTNAIEEDGREGIDVVTSRAGWMNAAEEDRFLESEIGDADLFHSLTGHWLPTAGGVATLHDLTPVLRPRLASGEAREAGRKIAEHAERASHLVVVSHSTARDAQVALGGRVPPMTVIPEAAAPVFRVGVPAGETLTRYELGADQYLLAIGGIGPHRNLDRLFEGYGQSGVQTPLVLTSSQHDAPAILGMIERHGLEDRVRIIQDVPDQDLAALYGRCRAFVHPSISEGFGLPVIEALACGAAVIACKTSSIPEVTGDAALLVDASRTRSFVSALRRVDTDAELREHLRRRAVVRAAAFSWARTAAATQRIYDQALEARAV